MVRAHLEVASIEVCFFLHIRFRLFVNHGRFHLELVILEGDWRDDDVTSGSTPTGIHRRHRDHQW